MRALSAALVFVSLALAQGVSAQDPDGEPGCVQSNPCEVIVEVGASGITDLSYSTFATGDWILLSIFNADEETHTLRLQGHSLVATVPAGDIVDTQPFRLGAPGVYALQDEPSGDSRAITVQAEEVFSTNGTTTGGNGIPALAPTVLLAALVALALIRRRR
jgi:hypothetical protein